MATLIYFINYLLILLKYQNNPYLPLTLNRCHVCNKQCVLTLLENYFNSSNDNSFVSFQVCLFAQRITNPVRTMRIRGDNGTGTSYISKEKLQP